MSDRKEITIINITWTNIIVPVPKSPNLYVNIEKLLKKQSWKIEALCFTLT